MRTANWRKALPRPNTFSCRGKLFESAKITSALLVIFSGQLVSKISETETDTEILAAQELDDRLKIVSLFTGHSDLTILELALHLGIKRFNCFDDLLCLITFQALFEMNFLARMSERRDRRILPFHIPQIDVPFRESPNHDFHQ